MKHAGFEERLDSIMVRGAIRLQERMRLAYFRGNLASYLERIGLSEGLEPLLQRGSLLDVQDEAVVLLASKIRQARKSGCLKEFLKQVNMLELLYKDQQRHVKPAGLEQARHKHVQVEGENRDSAESAKERALRLGRLTLIK